MGDMDDRTITQRVYDRIKREQYSGVEQRRAPPLDLIKVGGFVVVLVTATLSIGGLYNKVHHLETQRAEDHAAFVQWNSGISGRVRALEIGE